MRYVWSWCVCVCVFFSDGDVTTYLPRSQPHSLDRTFKSNSSSSPLKGFHGRLRLRFNPHHLTQFGNRWNSQRSMSHLRERSKKKKHSCFFLASMVIKASVIYSEFHLRTGSITFLGLLDFVCWSFSCISSIISSWWFSYSSSLFIPSLHFPSSFQSFL